MHQNCMPGFEAQAMASSDNFSEHSPFIQTHAASPALQSLIEDAERETLKLKQIQIEKASPEPLEKIGTPRDPRKIIEELKRSYPEVNEISTRYKCDTDYCIGVRD